MFLLCLYLFFIQFNSVYSKSNVNKLPPKRPNKFRMFIKYIINKMFNKKVLYSSFIIFTVGLVLRSVINYCIDLDVFKEYLNLISLSYFAFMALFSALTKEVIAGLVNGDSLVLYSGVGQIPPVAGNAPGGGNPFVHAHQLRAGRVNGPIQVTDPLNQGGLYIVGGNNQPYLTHLGNELDRQRQLGLSSLSRYTFTPGQEQYVLTFLLHSHPNVYNNIMHGQTGNVDQPLW